MSGGGGGAGGLHSGQWAQFVKQLAAGFHAGCELNSLSLLLLKEHAYRRVGTLQTLFAPECVAANYHRSTCFDHIHISDTLAL